MRIKKEHCIGLVIDFQERLFPFIHESEKLTKNVCILIEGLKAFHIPLVVTQQYTKGLGATIEPIAKTLGNFSSIEKASFSCCDEPKCMSHIAQINKAFVIVTGIESHVCVLQTVVDLLENGFHPIVVEDCVSSRNENDKKMAIERMRKEGVIITTYESILFELCRYSGTEQFKAISKLVK